MSSSSKSILVDAREFVPNRNTGISRVLEGLTDALVNSDMFCAVSLATTYPYSVPAGLRDEKAIEILKMPRSFLASERRLSDESGRGYNVFISLYPKLPLLGTHCPCVHIIHDVLDLTHPAYSRRPKMIFDLWRLKRALRLANLTWYDSAWSMEETRKLTGGVGRNPKVRHPGISEIFTPESSPKEPAVLERYGLSPGFILVVGNGLPHKNLGVLLSIVPRISRRMVFAGVRAENQRHWKARFPQAEAVWIEHVPDEDLPVLMRSAFCLAQPSSAEGYGYPPIEAMACGIPAIVSDMPVLVETTGGNALMADPHEPPPWLRALEMLEDSGESRTQIEKGLKWTAQLRGRNAWRGHIEDIKRLLDTIDG